jgi:hypothetical protein
MNTNPNNQPMGFWRDWYARIGLGLFLLGIVDVFVPEFFVKLGVWPKPQPPPSTEYLMLMETFAVRFVLLPIVIAFLLLVVAAGRLLRRKKIF